MYWDHVKELFELDDELNTVELLRKHIPSHQLYKVDRRMQRIAVIERICEAEENGDLNLLVSDED
jgi:hypothetical protein